MPDLILGESLEALMDHRGKTPTKLGGDFAGEGVPVASAMLVQDGRLVLEQARRVSAELYERWMPVRTRRHDVILTSEAPLGRVALVPDDQPLILGQRVFGLRGRRGVLDSRFLYYALQTDSVQSELHGRATGTTVTGIRQSELVRVRIPAPDYVQQQAIAAVLGALDDKIASNELCVRIAYQLMKLHFQLAIAGGSVTAAIGDVATVFDGPHATPEKTSSGPWFLSISSLRGGRLVLSESAHLGDQDFARWTRRVTPMAGDVLFSYETRLGEAALMPDGVRACLGRRMALLRPRIDVVGPRTLLQAYLGESFQETIRQRAVHGATVDRIPLTELPAWPITVPERAGRLESLLGAIDDTAAQRERENETLAALRETLLPKLMSGQIRVRDALKVLEEAP